MNFKRNDPKSIPRLGEKSALESYKDERAGIKQNNVVQSNGSFSNKIDSQKVVKAPEKPPHEEIANLKSSAFLGKHMGMQTRPVARERSEEVPKVKEVDSKSFSNVSLGKMNTLNTNPESFGTTMMEELGQTHVKLEKVEDQQVDPNSYQNRLNELKKERNKVKWHFLTAIISIIFIVILSITIYTLFGPNSNKQQLFCVTDNFVGENPMVLTQKTYYSKRSGLYKLETKEQYIFKDEISYQQYLQNLKLEKNQTVTEEATNLSLIIQSTVNLDNQKEKLEELKKQEEQTGLKCNIK